MPEARRGKKAEVSAPPNPGPNPAWTARKLAARQNQPRRIRLLLIAESPPRESDRYFYFEEPSSEDPLFEGVCEVLFEEKPRPDRKSAYLRQLRRRGVFVTELKPDAPRGNEGLAPYVPWFALGHDPAAAERVVLVGEDAWAAARRSLEEAGFPVVDVKVPAPGSGDDTAFRRELRKALVRAGLEKLIKPLSPAVKAALEE